MFPLAAAPAAAIPATALTVVPAAAAVPAAALVVLAPAAAAAVAVSAAALAVLPAAAAVPAAARRALLPTVAAVSTAVSATALAVLPADVAAVSAAAALVLPAALVAAAAVAAAAAARPDFEAQSRPAMRQSAARTPQRAQRVTQRVVEKTAAHDFFARALTIGGPLQTPTQQAFARQRRQLPPAQRAAFDCPGAADAVAIVHEVFGSASDGSASDGSSSSGRDAALAALLAVGETAIQLHPASPSSRCSNRDGEGGVRKMTALSPPPACRRSGTASPARAFGAAPAC